MTAKDAMVDYQVVLTKASPQDVSPQIRSNLHMQFLLGGEVHIFGQGGKPCFNQICCHERTRRWTSLETSEQLRREDIDDVRTHSVEITTHGPP
jgi:hypothetical protein